MSRSTVLAQWEQFLIITIGLWCMGAGTGFERSLLPRMAVITFHQMSAATRLRFVATFGASKAVANAFSGPLADKFGRKPTLLLGFLVGLPVMPFVIIAQSWTGITVMNIAFGLSQGLLGSSLFFLLIDLLGPTRRGIAVGFGEASIYVSTALVNILAGRLASRYGFRPVPFVVATGFAVVGLLSTIPLQDTLDKVREEQSSQRSIRAKYARLASIQPSRLDEEIAENARGGRKVSTRSVQSDDDDIEHGEPPGDAEQPANGDARPLELARQETPFASRTKKIPSVRFSVEELEAMKNDPAKESYHSIPSYGANGSNVSEVTTDVPDPPLEVLKELLSTNPNYVALCITGMVVNVKDGFAWGSLPVFFAHEHSLSDSDTDFLVALYPLCWGFSQAFTGALSDKFGRKNFLVAGTAACAIAMAMYPLAGRFWGALGDHRHIALWTIADILLGIGTALAYPALQAGAADEVDPINRGAALGFYRFIRDMGYVIGAVVCGHLTDQVGYDATFLVVGLILAASLVFMIWIYTPTRTELGS